MSYRAAIWSNIQMTQSYIKMTHSYIKMKHSYIKMILASGTVLVFQQQQSLGRRFCNSKMHLSHPRGLGCYPKTVVLLLLIRRLLLLPLWEYVFVICFVVRYFMSILVLQSSWWGRESWLLGLVCFPGVLFDCCVTLPCVAMGLSAVCDCGISWSYSLTILHICLHYYIKMSHSYKESFIF